jgi:hypothetical protein
MMPLPTTLAFQEQIIEERVGNSIRSLYKNKKIKEIVSAVLSIIQLKKSKTYYYSLLFIYVKKRD